MLPLLLFLFFSISAIVWMLYSKRATRTDMLTLGLPALAVLVNAVLVYRFVSVGLSTIEHIIQMMSCASVVPLVYMHFLRKIGRPMNNTTVVILWLLGLLSLLPEVVIYNPFAAYEPLRFTPKPFALYVVSHGEKLWAIYMGDLMVILQALLTVLRVAPAVLWLRENGLRLSRTVYAFFAWWIISAAYIAVVSGLDESQLTTTAGMWFYYMGMAVSTVMLNVFFALGYDHHPVETEQGEVVESVDEYIDMQYAELARQMEEIMTTEQLFRHPGYTVEDMCERLNTNRKVLALMMQSQYGVRFPEYLNNLRLQYAQQLLLTSAKKMELVAEESGFAGRSHLNRLFKQQLGCTPSQWLKDQKKSSPISTPPPILRLIIN